MKKIFSLIILAACVSAFGQAPDYGVTTILAANSATCAATAGTNVAKTFTVQKQDTFALQIELMADANGAYTFTVPIQYSVDGSVYATMAPYSIPISFNGVTKQTIVTNVPTYGCGYFKIPHLTNATAAINVTNIVIKRGVKISAP